MSDTTTTNEIPAAVTLAETAAVAAVTKESALGGLAATAVVAAVNAEVPTIESNIHTILTTAAADVALAKTALATSISKAKAAMSAVQVHIAGITVDSSNINVEIGKLIAVIENDIKTEVTKVEAMPVMKIGGEIETKAVSFWDWITRKKVVKAS